jgi:hypothetical protein
MKGAPSLKRAIAIGIVGAMAFCEITPSFAAPVFSSAAIVATTAPNMIDQVRSRRGRAVGAGIALGVIGGMIGAAAAQNQGYYGPGYYGGPGYNGPGYYGPGYAPGYYYGGYDYDPGPAIALGIIGAAAGAIDAVPHNRGQRGCYVVTDKDRNYGYWGPCR